MYSAGVQTPTLELSGVQFTTPPSNGEFLPPAAETAKNDANLQRVISLKPQVHDFRIFQRTLVFAQRMLHSAVPVRRPKRHMGDSTSFSNAPDASRVPNTPAFHKRCPFPNFNTSHGRQFE